MPAMVGEMFYTGEMPWHGIGREVPGPLRVAEALEAAGLRWRVGEISIQTAEPSPSPAAMRKAIVRVDRPPGAADRVLGVVHPGFTPLQNADGARVFDAIFGHGRSVYHTGGYLGRGERVWLLARLDQAFEVGAGDQIQPYALFANSHDGSLAVVLQLTTVRVVCQNTLSLALKDRRLGQPFRMAHDGPVEVLAREAADFFGAATLELREVEASFGKLASIRCDDAAFRRLTEVLFPLPEKPRADASSAILKRYQTQVDSALEAREMVHRLLTEGRGTALPRVRGTYWGAFNAISEFVDHHQTGEAAGVVHSLFGPGAALKQRAFREALAMSTAA